MTHLLAAAVAIILSIFLAPLSIKLARRYKFMDQPEARKVHTIPKPCLGGAAIYTSFTLTCLLFLPKGLPLFTVLGGGTIFFILGLIDDRLKLSPRVKFLVELAVAIAVVLIGIQHGFLLRNPFGSIGGTSFLIWLGVPFSVLWIVGIANAVNLIDGLDGLASGIILIACAVLTGSAIFNPVISLNPMLPIAFGSILGYIRYNIYPSKTIMGDSGSLFLGYVIAIIALSSYVKIDHSIFFSLIPPAMALFVPIFDTFIAILRRRINGNGIFSPDKNHLHHCLLHHGYSHPRAVLIVWGLSFAFGLVSMLLGILIYKQVLVAMVLLGMVVVWALTSAARMGLLKDRPDLNKDTVPFGVKVAATSEYIRQAK